MSPDQSQTLHFGEKGKGSKIRPTPEEICFALEGVKDTVLKLSEGLIPFNDGSVRVKFNPSKSEVRIVNGVIACLLALICLAVFIKDGVKDLALYMQFGIYLSSGVALIFAGKQIFNTAQKYHSPMILNSTGLYHFSFGFLNWGEIRDFYIREVGFWSMRQDRPAMHLLLHSEAYARVRTNKKNGLGKRDSLLFHDSDKAVDIELDHLHATLIDLHRCMQFFFYWYYQGEKPPLPWITAGADAVPRLRTRPLSGLHELRTDALLRRLATLRKRREVKK